MIRVAFDLLKPFSDVIESELLGYVVHEYDALGSFVVGLGDCAKSFLICGFPHLKFDYLVQNINCLVLEVDA